MGLGGELLLASLLFLFLFFFSIFFLHQPRASASLCSTLSYTRASILPTGLASSSEASGKCVELGSQGHQTLPPDFILSTGELPSSPSLCF
jgi:hypothetical protein